MRTRRSVLLIAVALASLIGGACSDDDPAVDTTATTADDTGSGTGSGTGTGEETETTVDEQMLPERIRRAQKLTVGSDIAYAPVEFFKEGTQEVQGIDPDLCNAVMKSFGPAYSCEFQNTPFDGLIPALNSKRFDVIMSSMTDNPERQQQVDFVNYFTAGTAILVKKGNPENIKSLDDLCGKTIGLQKGTIQADLAGEQVRKCAEANKGKLTVNEYDKDTDALLQLKNGRTVAGMNDYPVAAYNAKTSGGGNDFEVVGEQLGAGPYGVALRKDDTELRDALKAGFAAILANGTYAEVLKKWDVSQGALTEITVNGGK